MTVTLKVFKKNQNVFSLLLDISNVSHCLSGVGDRVGTFVALPGSRLSSFEIIESPLFRHDSFQFNPYLCGVLE